ncbi:MAG TPA: TadE/TadG family type IV pilus assembly protein [Verrucomicrobiae bacterium]|nr:TadE/TadG family type IV pilus assembly protein [Verrucomicrobiae bacterium]
MLNHWISRSRGRSGQALIEFTFVAIILLVMLFGMIDFCRSISTRQVLINLSREGANMAARGGGETTDDAISNAIQAVIVAANPLNMTNNGQVIVSAVVNSSGVFRITNQMSSPTLLPQVQKSKIGLLNATGSGLSGSGVTMPLVATAPGALPQPNQTTFVAEIFYAFKPATPIGQLLNFGMTNAPLYDVAYF